METLQPVYLAAMFTKQSQVQQLNCLRKKKSPKAKGNKSADNQPTMIYHSEGY
jgi:hypothetical protein